RWLRSMGLDTSVPDYAAAELSTNAPKAALTPFREKQFTIIWLLKGLEPRCATLSETSRWSCTTRARQRRARPRLAHCRGYHRASLSCPFLLPRCCRPSGLGFGALIFGVIWGRKG